MTENTAQQQAETRRLLHEKIVERAERFNEEIKQAALVVEMMKHPGWAIFVSEIKKLEQQFAKPDILEVKSEQDLHVRHGATIFARLVDNLPTTFEAKAKDEMLDEAKAVALYGDLVIDEVENTRLSVDPSLDPQDGVSTEPRDSNLN